MSAAAFAGVIGLGLAASPVMAAEPTGNTDVFYTTDSTTIDADGKVVMVVPASVSLNKNAKSQEFAVTMKTTDPNGKLPQNFSAEVKVDSKNNGMLVMDNNEQKKAAYTLTKNQTPIDLKKDWTDFHTFTTQSADTHSVEQKATVAVDDNNSKIMENEKPGTTFKDQLTFKVTSVSGEGLDGSNITPNQKP